MRIIIFFIWIFSIAAAGAAGWQFLNPIARDLRSVRAIGRNYTEARFKVYSTIAALRYCNFTAGGTKPGRVELLRVLSQELGGMDKSLGSIAGRLRAQEEDINNMGGRLRSSHNKWTAICKTWISKNPSFVALAISRESKLSMMENFAAAAQRRAGRVRERIDREIAAVKASQDKINAYLAEADRRGIGNNKREPFFGPMGCFAFLFSLLAIVFKLTT